MCDPLVGMLIGGLISLISCFATYQIFKKERLDKHLFVILERRFEVNQKAYFYAEELITIIHTEEQDRNKLINEIRVWYNSHCLFLNPSVRKVFKDAVFETGVYYLRLEDYKMTGREKGWEADETKLKRTEIEEIFKKITGEIKCLIEKDLDEGYWSKV